MNLETEVQSDEVQKLTIEEQKDILKKLDLGDGSKDPAAGIFYRMKYDNKDLINIREKIAEALVGIFEISIIKGMLDLEPKNSVESGEHACNLIEELDTLNVAIRLQDDEKFDIKNFRSFKNTAIDNYFDLFTNGNLEQACEHVIYTIPNFIEDILFAHEENNVLSEDDFNALIELEEFCRFQEIILKTKKCFSVIGDMNTKTYNKIQC